MWQWDQGKSLCWGLLDPFLLNFSLSPSNFWPFAFRLCAFSGPNNNSVWVMAPTTDNSVVLIRKIRQAFTVTSMKQKMDSFSSMRWINSLIKSLKGAMEFLFQFMNSTNYQYMLCNEQKMRQLVQMLARSQLFVKFLAPRDLTRYQTVKLDECKSEFFTNSNGWLDRILQIFLLVLRLDGSSRFNFQVTLVLWRVILAKT